MDDKLGIWKQVEQPPDWALKPIAAGRLKGKTDINPQWRLHAMTEVFGPCGQGWWFMVDRQWLEPGPDGEIAAFVNITLYTEDCDKGIPGTGGSTFVADERAGLHMSDEAYKMALTDALSVAMKFLGVAARIYYGAAATKYSPNPTSEPSAPKKTGTKKQVGKEEDETKAKVDAAHFFDVAWSDLMEAVGEDDADNSDKLRQHFLKTTTEKSDAFLAMTDSLNGLRSKEVKLLTAMVTKGRDKLAGLCVGEWRKELKLPSLGVETCPGCAEIVSPKDKEDSITVGLDRPWCAKCRPDAVVAMMSKKGAGKDE